MNTQTVPTSLRNYFLIAMPSLGDSIFANSVTYICEHNEYGAMGLVVNQPLDISIDEVFDQLDIYDHEQHSEHVLAGGPVEMNRGFVLHRSADQQWQSSLAITAELSLTTSLDILTAIAHNEGPDDCLITLGYAGWGAGQLENEIANNAWLTVPADLDILFHTPCEQRLSKAATMLGVDLSLISPTVGHA